MRSACRHLPLIWQLSRGYEMNQQGRDRLTSYLVSAQSCLRYAEKAAERQGDDTWAEALLSLQLRIGALLEHQREEKAALDACRMRR
uniref:Uncharacterized protein n=1 Tax=uncultured prokaryote TaxID=198431 RepID=A0A0H5Q1W0_9ZZZZ|nr:hypothetical protein [uncultured prokaryote]